MKLYGHALPLDDGGFVVTVICPNEGSKNRLLVELSRIEADAFAPEIALYETGSATGGGLATHYVEPPEAPEPTPEQAAYMEAVESREAATPADMGLNVDVEGGP